MTLDSRSPVVGFGLAGEDLIISASIYERRRDSFVGEDWAEDELGDVITIEALDPNASLSLALLASVAIAISRMAGRPINDDLPFFSQAWNSLPDEFATAVVVSGRFDDYKLAATEFKMQLLRRRNL
jgi:hypothetical protein